MTNNDTIRHLGPNFPTLTRHNSSTSPDTVWSNNRTFHNIHLKPGPFTSSDHIPIIATITCNPIQIPIRPRLQIAKADWDAYTDKLTNNTLPTNPHPLIEEIDDYLDIWTNEIKQTATETIPTIRYRTIPGV